MKPNWIYFCLIAALLSSSASSQKKEIKFHTIAKAGITSGKSGVYGSFNLVNGITHKKWFAGIGAGYDYYRFKTVPLFVTIERYFGNQDEIFINADLGYNFPSKSNKPGKEIFFYNSYKFDGGIYSAFSVGYKIKFYKLTSFFVSTGYSYKEIHNKIGVANPCLVGPCPEDFSRYDYNFGTITIKGGIDLKW